MAVRPLVGGQIVYDFKTIKWIEHVTAGYLDAVLEGLRPGGHLPDLESNQKNYPRQSGMGGLEGGSGEDIVRIGKGIFPAPSGRGTSR